ncbi:MAG: hypothetical protein M9926_16415 [Lentimicrobium sp.]|uniref:hypothetical protein n=1 Tax=Lentimicrobium sp. TaxID=2034841 RepID=UPI0025FD9B93|nr:hypothetical protein [Lentimicrobium sp.]MCO5258331.1 hypothetical protein [Lentimicrobium sp.]
MNQLPLSPTKLFKFTNFPLITMRLLAQSYCWLPVFAASKGGRCNLSFCRVASAISATKLGGKALHLHNFLKKLNLYFFSEAVLLNWQPTIEYPHNSIYIRITLTPFGADILSACSPQI